MSRKQFFNIMAFSNGPICNLNCEYCYYLNKTKYYQNVEDFRMSEELLEEYIQQYIEAHSGPRIYFGWQGGEPTLRGLDFYKKAVKLQQRYLPEGWECYNNLQTNAVLLDEKWCRFLKEKEFLVGVSIDGPEYLHNKYRKNKNNKGTHNEVIKGIKLLKKYKVDFNILCVVNKFNSQYPVEVYNFYKEIGADFIQFIPLVESGERDSNEYSVAPGDYGRFLIAVFDEWIKYDYGKIFAQIFEEVLKVWAGYKASICVFSESCGDAAVIEHNGDFYSCDHFVYPEYKLGNIKETSIEEMINSTQQQEFGNNKYKSLPEECLNCKFKFICRGGCPKNRIVETEKGEKINYLCLDYKMFFSYISPYMEELTTRIKKRQDPSIIQKELIKLHDEIWDVGRNDPCPCGSGKKYKKCCINRK